jgi:hypothetical protein
MRKLTPSDIKDHREYERERDDFRAEVIALKKRRRMKLGHLMSLVFENEVTMRFQVQEMARAERMLRDEQIATELDTYNQLIPDAGDLSATLFIEIDDDAALHEWLPRLVGIEDHVAVAVGADIVRAHTDDPERLTRDDTTSTVHYLKFTFTPEQQRGFADGPVRLVVDHPQYEVDVTLTDEQRESLADDFTT